MNFIIKIKQFIENNCLLRHNETVVIGLSGGPDSIFLLHLFIILRPLYNLTLVIAHLNHQWRSEADEEEKMCQLIAQEYAIEFISEKLSQIAHHANFNGSKEEYARTIRRYFLEKVAQQKNAHRIALGHHAQDQQETFFIRLIRGSSLSGLVGIKPCNGLYIRPLLETNKDDILSYLKDNGISYLVDMSNESLSYLRNRLRLMVLPALRLCDDRFESNFLSTLTKLSVDHSYFERVVQKEFSVITIMVNDRLMLDIKDFFLIDSALHHRLLIHWFINQKVKFSITEAFLDEIIRFLKSSRGGAHAVSNAWAIIKKQGKAYIVVKVI